MSYIRRALVLAQCVRILLVGLLAALIYAVVLGESDLEE